MSLVLDGLIIVCGLCCVISGIRHGFIRSVIGLVKGVVSLLAAWAYTPVIRDTIKDNYIIKQIADGIAETMESLALNLESRTYDLSKVAADLPEAYTSILERYGIDIESFTAKIAGITQADEALIYDYSTQIAELIQGQTRRGADGTTVISLCGLRAEQKTSNRTEGDIAMEQRALAHLIFLAMLDQNPDDYCFVVHWLFDDPDLYRQLNVNMDGLIVCTEYQSHGYSSVTAYYDAVRSGREENHGDLYTVSLGSTNVSLFPNTP